ncbi:hypothetical protein M758_12G133300 [Ceratodon purpureus]|nr:hypothetical protein M758_12G133300 [Ceratodon purpureus]
MIRFRNPGRLDVLHVPLEHDICANCSRTYCFNVSTIFNYQGEPQTKRLNPIT